MGSDTVTGEINYFRQTNDNLPPWIDGTPKLGTTASNHLRTPVSMTIHDVRGKEKDYNIDVNGFEVAKYDGHVNEVFDDQTDMQRCYYEELTNFLQKRLGASRVVIFNHIFRFRGKPLSGDQCDYTHKNPVYFPHVDHKPASTRAKVIEVLGEEDGQKLMQKRFQLINIWRPLGPNPIIHMPLTICDYRSIDVDKDLHTSSVRESKATGEVAIVSRNIEDAHKWHYLSEMRSDEMWVFKIFDSNPNVAQFGAHTAFINKHAPSTDTQQCSIEARCFVFYDE